MTIALYTNIISPHQLPLARELVSIVGKDNYRYVFSEPFHLDRESMGWKREREDWIVGEHDDPVTARQWLMNADVLICGNRDLDIIEARAKAGKKTFYANERWFKPIDVFRARLLLPGSLRMLHPRYRKMAKRFVSLVNAYDALRVLPFGVWARKDFLRIGVSAEKIDLWGYYVAPGRGSLPAEARSPLSGMRVLWVGRMLDWKRVDVLVNAFRKLYCSGDAKCKLATLTLVGDGPELGRLKRLAKGLPVEFVSSVPINEIREMMRQHDVYVLASNGQEGWGAALNEALEEGMLAIGTYEAGASATMLPESNLFHAGDPKALSALLEKALSGELPKVDIGDWSARRAAVRFMELCR